MIVGENNTGKLDLGIFIASIVPDGPADRDGRIRPGTEQRAKTSLWVSDKITYQVNIVQTHTPTLPSGSILL